MVLIISFLKFYNKTKELGKLLKNENFMYKKPKISKSYLNLFYLAKQLLLILRFFYFLNQSKQFNVKKKNAI